MHQKKLEKGGIRKSYISGDSSFWGVLLAVVSRLYFSFFFPVGSSLCSGL